MNITKTDKKVRAAQRGEIKEHFIYQKLAESTKSAQNKAILLKISSDEMRRYNL